MASPAQTPARVTLVTGGSSGIGKVVATRIAGLAGHVVVAGRPGGTAQDVADQITAARGQRFGGRGRPSRAEADQGPRRRGRRRIRPA